MSLSEKIRFWRADRPSEYLMDEYIRDAEGLEAKISELEAALELCKPLLFQHQATIRWRSDEDERELWDKINAALEGG